MSENRSVYLSLNIDQGEKVTCPYCQALMGEIISIDDAEVLKTGENSVAKFYYGYCVNCGNEFHWSSNDRIFARLIKKVMDLRDEIR